MRVDAYNKVTQLYQTNSTRKPTKVNSTSVSDQVEISSIGKEYQVAKQAIANAADVRTEKINDIKKRMESGTYNVSMEEVADKVLNSYYDTSI
jgi:negative regulator of flagellin synthesis FlgM